MSARSEVLGRIRVALGPRRPVVLVPRDYRQADDQISPPALLDLLADRLRDYGATVRRAVPGGVAGEVDAALREAEARSVVVPPGLDPAFRPTTAGVRVDDPPLPVAELDTLDAVVASCAVAVAETGTLVLDAGPGSGRRAITLIPDVFVCVVPEEVVVQRVPAGLRRVDPTRPLTFVSGPSATVDIEFQRVQGVHGPRTLAVVLVVGDVAPSSG